MIELTRHIENLLLTHDCVIVPGLGGFVTQYVPSNRISQEQIFLPPYRSIRFNQQLFLNDGLLVQSYMQAYGTNYPETIKIINSAVNNIKQTLQKEGKYELIGIGCLTLGIEENYEFTPCEAGVISPELYGLDSFTISEIKESEETLEKDDHENSNQNEPSNSDGKNYTIRINRELVNYIAAAIIAIAFYFIWVPSIVNNTTDNRQAASLVYEQLFKNTEKAKNSNKVNKNIHIQDNSKQLVTQEKDKNVATDNNNEIKYTIVLASSISKRNAKRFTNQLNNKGFKDASTYIHKRMVRVIYGQYSNYNEALQSLRNLRNNKDFKDAWVMKLP